MKRTRILLFCLAVMLSGCGQPAAVPILEPQPPVEAAASPPTETADPIVFPPTTEMLGGKCGDFAPLEDDGSRKVTIEFIDLRSDGPDLEATYDLASTPLETGGPILTLWRNQPLGGPIYAVSRPIQEKVDRGWVLDSLDEADFGPAEEEPWTWSMVLYVEDGGEKTEYRVDVDGTLYRKMPDGTLWVARQAVDYFRFSALAYKYANDAYEVGGYYSDQWLAGASLWDDAEPPEEFADWWDNCYPLPPAAHYRLCLQSEDFHTDLDREQALVMLRALFGVSWMGGASIPPDDDFAAKELDWTPGESGIRLTEYLIPLGTPYEDYLRATESVIEQTFYLYSDGTLARVPQSDPAHEHFEYGIERLNPSWQRVAVLESAFDPAVLNACLEALGFIQPE